MKSQEPIFTLPFVGLMTSNGLLRICTNMLITLVPLYAIEHGASTTTAGLTTTVYMLAAVVVRPLSGRLVDTRGRFAVMVFGSLLFCVATGLYALVMPVWMLLAVRVIQGLGFSFNGTAVMTLATDLIPESRMAEGIGYLGMEQTVAQLFAPWLALAVKNAYGYSAVFGLVFAFATLNLLLRIPLKRVAAQVHTDREGTDRALPAAGDAGPGSPASRESDKGRAKEPLWSRVIERNVWRPAMIMFFLMLGPTAINTFMAAYTVGRGISNPGLFFTASAVTLAVARLCTGRMQRRLGTAWTIAPGIVSVAAALALVGWSPNLGALMAAGACYGWGMGTAHPGINALAVLSADKTRRGRSNATVFMAMDLSRALGAVGLGALAGLTGIGSVFVASSGVVAATSLTYLGLRARGLVK
ncbi:MFS transporter [Streptomyces sp. BBFR51]|uniref:MFS transporter n=1 Tax=Streptomyces sp. BBFR51 TaxID=3372856 RepID=UPI0037DC992F